MHFRPGLTLLLGAIILFGAVWAQGEPRPEREGELEYFPCMDCHQDQSPNVIQRTLEDEHEDIILEHGSEGMWCLSCHYVDNRDSLTVFSGSRIIGFQDSPQLCGSCHGPNYRYWEMGIHGKTTGHWDLPEPRWLCVECHDPHKPAFAPLEPEAPPQRPRGYKPPGGAKPASEDTTSQGEEDHDG